MSKYINILARQFKVRSQEREKKGHDKQGCLETKGLPRYKYIFIIFYDKHPQIASKNSGASNCFSPLSFPLIITGPFPTNKKTSLLFLIDHDVKK